VAFRSWVVRPTVHAKHCSTDALGVLLIQDSRMN
jgi:hypothetical protein